MDQQPASELKREDQPPSVGSWRLFDRIAGWYDFLNRLLSLRRDVAWRKRLIGCLPPREGLRVLDLAAGTGDVMLTLAARRPDFAVALGLDMSDRMLEVARSKIARRGLGAKLPLVRADAARLPILGQRFDAVTMAFGIRNVPDFPEALAEARRVLREGGSLLVLEFSLPSRGPVRWGYLLYLRHFLPRLAGLVSRDRAAYRYLNTTIEAFPYGDAFLEHLRQAGFRDVRALPLTFGVATIYQGVK